jgi:hypothetical protein
MQQLELFPSKPCDICKKPVYIKQDKEYVYNGFRCADSGMFIGFNCCRKQYYENKHLYTQRHETAIDVPTRT